MSVHYTIYREYRLVISVADGHLTFAQVREHQDRLLGDPDFDPSFNQLADFTTTTVFAVSVEEAKRIANRKIFSQTSKRALIAKQPVIFGTARLMQAYHELHSTAQINVFSDRDEALKWLGIPEGSRGILRPPCIPAS